MLHRRLESLKIGRNNPATCPECSFATNSKVDLLDHINSNHILYPAFHCNFCERTFYSKRRLVDHSRRNHLEKEKIIQRKRKIDPALDAERQRVNEAFVRGSLRIEIENRDYPFLEISSLGEPMVKLCLEGDDISIGNAAILGSNSDFAECMIAQKIEYSEMRPGSIVNLRNGIITTSGFESDNIIPRVISTNSFFLGNFQKGQEYIVKVALFGQTPVYLKKDQIAQRGDLVFAGFEYGEVVIIKPSEKIEKKLCGRLCGIAVNDSQIEADGNNYVIIYLNYSTSVNNMTDKCSISSLTDILIESFRSKLSKYELPIRYLNLNSLSSEAKTEPEVTCDISEKIIFNWKENNRSCIIMLSHGGCGKSSSSLEIGRKVLEKSEKNVFPIYAQLGRMKNPRTECIEESFEMNGVDRKDASKLQNTRILLIIEDYDHLGETYNIFETNNFHLWNIDVILTCRYNYISEVEKKDLFFTCECFSHIQFVKLLPLTTLNEKATDLEEFLQVPFTRHLILNQDLPNSEVNQFILNSWFDKEEKRARIFYHNRNKIYLSNPKLWYIRLFQEIVNEMKKLKQDYLVYKNQFDLEFDSSHNSLTLTDKIFRSQILKETLEGLPIVLEDQKIKLLFPSLLLI